jgi:hypothetical protein
MQCPHCHLESEVPRVFWGQPVVCPNCSGQFIVSDDAFDPYYKWLGIPPAQQPPNLYRLLGLQFFEPNLDVIENAADRQMVHVRSYQLGPHAAESQQLLNEIAAARVVLLDPYKKAAYDDQLRRILAPVLPAPHYQAAPAAAPAVAGWTGSAAPPSHAMPIPIPPPTAASIPPPPPPSPSAAPMEAHVPVTDSSIRRPSRLRSRRQESSGVLTTIMIVAGAIVGLALGALIIFYITGHDYLGLSANARKQFEGSQDGGPKEKIPKSQQSPKKQGPPGPAPLPPPLDPRKPNQVPAPAPMLGPPQVPPAPDVPPLARAFPKAVNLPDTSSREPMVLAQIPGDAADPVEFTLHSGLAALPATAELVGEMNTADGYFTVSYVPPPSLGLEKMPLAVLRRDENELVFRWLESPANPAVCRQVANCLLVVSVGGESRKLQLREPLVAPRLEVDLEDDKQDFDIEIEDLPKLGRIRLTALSLGNFEGGKLRGGASVCEFSKSVFIEFEKMKGPQIEVQLLQQPKTKALLIKLEGLFRESASRKFELSLRRLDKVQRAQENVLSEARAARSQAQALLTSAQSRLQQLLANPPAPALQAQWQAEIAACRTTIAAAPKTFERLDAQIAEAQARLAAVPQVLGFISSLHKKACIEYSIVAIDGDDEILLARKAGDK